MYIQEKNEKWLNFFTPAVLAVVGISLASLAVMPIILVNLIVPILGEDSTIANLSMAVLGQFIGALLVVFILIPLFKVKNVEYYPASGSNTLKTVLIFCFGFFLFIISNLLFFLVYSVLNLEPTSAYQEMDILLTPDHLNNPINIALFLGMAVIGAPVAEEYVFRRTVIPLLEERGMAPFAAAFASSLIFTLVHAPNDLLYGNLPGTAQHLWDVFIIGIAAGIAYILTRNVLYPIMIHGLFNGLSFAGYLVTLADDLTLAAVLGLLVIGSLIIGVGGGVYAIRKYRKVPMENWVVILKEKSEINIVPGLLGFLAIFSALIALQILAPLVIWIAIPSNALVNLLITILVSVLLIIGPLWLATKAKYIDKSQVMNFVEVKAQSGG